MSRLMSAFLVISAWVMPVSMAHAQWQTMEGWLLFTSNRDGDEEIFKARLTAGADMTEVTQLTFNSDKDDGARFSPDGTSIAFIRNDKDIWMMDSQGGNPRFIHTGKQVCFSPDGKKLAFADYGGSLYTYDLETQKVAEIVHATIYSGSNQSPDWSPDGQKIVYKNTFLYMLPHFTNVMVVNADGSGKTALTDYNEYNDVRVFDPRWSADGTSIIYQCAERVCRMNADGSNKNYPYSLTIGGTSSSPVWSPDGAWIIFNLDGSSRDDLNGKQVLLKLDLTKASTFTDADGHPGNNHPTDWRAVSAAAPTGNECFFNWAEVNYPSLFAPSGTASSAWSVYAFRYYSTTDAFLAVSSADSHVYYLGADRKAVDVGPVSTWLSLAGCQ